MVKSKLFETIAKEFLKSLNTQPVKTLELYEQSGLLKELMPELLALKGCEQPKEFHSEGDAWQHTLLCLKNLQSSEFKKHFKGKPDLEVIVALLLHDIDKPNTQVYSPDKKRFTFPGHEKSSAILAGQIASRLTFASYNGLINYDNLKWLISNHMISKAAKPKEIKATKLEKLFFTNPQLGEKLLILCFADDISCLTPEGPNLEGYKILKHRLTE
ncbi:MAG: HD domain-containing protein, partial [Candidatus Parcubacteria bacterium]|nr:HD domain-containing protein [Candidatus Parcubacteria bacterium]